VNAITERIVFEESTRLLASQEAVLAGLRERAGILLAGATLVTSFLAPPALEHRTGAVTTQQLTGFSWAAVGAFAAAVIASLVVLWPYQWVFGHSSHSLMDELLDTSPPADEASIFRHLAYYNDTHHSANQAKLWGLFVAFEIGCLAVAAEIGLWIAAIVH